jgi:hypothetical protein
LIFSALTSSSDKDRLEGEVGVMVKACSQHLDRLKESVLAVQQQQQRDASGRPTQKAQAIAHLHGVVSVDEVL